MSGNKQQVLGTAPDPYEAEPIFQQVSLPKQKQLIEQAKLFAASQKLFKSEAFFSEPYYYLVSSKWLKRWKQYVSYDEIVSDQEPQKLLGCGLLPRLNQDIVDKIDYCSLNLSKEMAHYDVKLRPGLAEHKDYEFVNKQGWEILDSYDNIQVKRFVQDTPDGQKVELYYQPLTIVPLWNNLLKDVEQERISKFTDLQMQFSHYSSLQTLTQNIKALLASFGRKQTYGSRFPEADFVRFWLIPETVRKTILYNTLQLGCKANPSFSYKLYLDGELLNMETPLRELDLLPESLLVAEMREEGEKWMFFNMKNKLQAPCSYCKKVTLLNQVCSCKHAVYCSKDCKQYDKGHHKYRCPNDAESDEEEKELTLNANSRRGLTGLRNLGNTCFMNSGLQCLSHMKELTEYFLSGKYLKEINKTNPLGTHGELSTEYAKMVKHLWLGEESSFSPTHLKKSIAKFQPMFSGYNQHDSGELITYLLDGLHEDLNRVIEKPYTDTKDYDGRPDHMIAQQSWQTYLKRNQSEIVDLMYGQFKSIVQCPNENCKFLSITFDPFSNCTLPLVDNSRKSLELVTLKQHIYSKKVHLTYTLEKDYTVEDKMDELKTLLGAKPDSRVALYVASYTSCEAISVKEAVDEVRKEYKYRTIFIRQLSPLEDPEKDMKIMLAHVICNPYYSDESYRKNIVPFQLVYAQQDITNKQVYDLIFTRYKKILESLSLPTESAELAQMEEEDKEPVRLLLITSSRYFSCNFCGKKNCSGCKLPYNDNLFRQYVGYNPDSEFSRDKRIEMELYWRKKEKEVEKVFDELGQQGDNMKYAAGVGSKAPTVTIQECLQNFQKEEVLGKDNEWYCPKCQDFVLAKKQMKIYKAPKILIFCLKRFKRKEYFSEKIGTLVDFPVEGLDMSPFICNPDMPNDYFKDGSKMQVEGPVLYDLMAISNHFGSTGGGHYTAYARDPESGDWYDFDDSSVSKLRSSEDVVSESAYILFYRRRD